MKRFAIGVLVFATAWSGYSDHVVSVMRPSGKPAAKAAPKVDAEAAAKPAEKPAERPVAKREEKSAVKPSKGLTVKGPDGDVAAVVAPDASGRLTWQVLLNKKEVLPPSPLGVTVDGIDLGLGVTPGKPSTRKFEERYVTRGLHDEALNRYREAVFPLRDASGSEVARLEVRVFDDGAAYRYVVPGSGARTVNGESGAWVLPAGSLVWYQRNVGCHEDVYIEQAAESVP